MGITCGRYLERSVLQNEGVGINCNSPEERGTEQVERFIRAMEHNVFQHLRKNYRDEEEGNLCLITKKNYMKFISVKNQITGAYICLVCSYSYLGAL